MGADELQTSVLGVPEVGRGSSWDVMLLGVDRQLTLKPANLGLGVRLGTTTMASERQGAPLLEPRLPARQQFAVDPKAFCSVKTDRPCCTTRFTASSLDSRLCFLRELPNGSSSFWSLDRRSRCMVRSADYEHAWNGPLGPIRCTNTPRGQAPRAGRTGFDRVLLVPACAERPSWRRNGSLPVTAAGSTSARPDAPKPTSQGSTECHPCPGHECHPPTRAAPSDGQQA